MDLNVKCSLREGGTLSSEVITMIMQHNNLKCSTKDLSLTVQNCDDFGKKCFAGNLIAGWTVFRGNLF